jgi:hypothetical protein
MSYQSQGSLATDPAFVQRVSACSVQQANIYINDTREDMKAFSDAILRFESAPQITLFNMVAAAPGLADSADVGDGTIDSTLVVDQAILSAVQAVWPTAAAAYFNSDGSGKLMYPSPPGVLLTNAPVGG